jgi:hypothetical protein
MKDIAIWLSFVVLVHTLLVGSKSGIIGSDHPAIIHSPTLPSE